MGTNLSLNNTLSLNSTSSIKNQYLGTSFVLQIWGSLIIGSTLAVIVTCIPLPVVPTAYRELTMRMRFIARQTRREITAIVLLISEYHDAHSSDDYNAEIKKKVSTPEDNDGGIEMPKKNSHHDEDIFQHSASFEDLRDDHLLKSDIQDLHSLVNDELKHMKRALTEIPFEPYFILLKFLNLIRSLLRHIPFIKKFIRSASTLQIRLSAWSASLASIQRTISGMLALDHHHHAFVGQRRLINVSFFTCKKMKIDKNFNLFQAIIHLLDSTFDFLDSTLPYTTASTSYFNIEYTITCRTRVEEALEDFF